MNMTDHNPIGSGVVDAKKAEFNQHVDKCLSMVYHYPEIEEFAAIIKRIGHKRLNEKAVSNERD